MLGTSRTTAEPTAAGGSAHPESSAPPKRAAKHHFAVGLPTVNLLSPGVLQDLAVRRLRRQLALVALVLVVLLGAGWGVQTARATRAEEQLAAQESQKADLTSQVGALAPVQRYHAAVERQKNTVTHAMASEVLFSRVMAELLERAPSGVRIETMSVEIQPSSGAAAGGAPGASGAGAACPAPDPFTASPLVGCVTLGGSAPDRDAVGALVVRLGDGALFVGPFISASNVSGKDEVVFTGTVGVTKKVFSGRYADLGWLMTTKGAR